MLSQAYLMNMQKNKGMGGNLSPSRQNPNSPYKYTMNRRAELLKRTMARIPPRHPPVHGRKVVTHKAKPKKKSVANVTQVSSKSVPAAKSLVSVIMVTENSRKYIYHAIYTILKQSHSNIELVIVDNNSQDDTVDFIKNLKDGRIKIYALKETTSNPNCYNLGMYVCKGQFITFQDPRYISISDRLTRQISQLVTNPKSISIVGEQLREDEEEGIKGNYQSMMISRDQLETFGYFYDNDKHFLEYVKRLNKHDVSVQLVNDLFYIRYDTLSNGIANNEYHLDTLDEYPEDQVCPEKKVEFEDLVKFGV